MILRPFNKGSKSEVKKAPVDKHAKVTDTFDTLIALKNVSQCSAMMRPANKKPNNIFGGTRNENLFNPTYNRIKTVAIDMRYQTSGKASSVINAPSTAVKPQMKTMRCRWR